jgi:hypothetical protein
MDDDPIKRIPISDMRQEDGANELATSEAMEPYLNYAIALMRGADTGIQGLPPQPYELRLRLGCLRRLMQRSHACLG